MEVAKEVFEIKRRSTPHHVVRRSFPLYAPDIASFIVLHWYAEMFIQRRWGVKNHFLK